MDDDTNRKAEIQKWMENIASNRGAGRKLFFDKKTKRLIVADNTEDSPDFISFTANEAYHFGGAVEPLTNEEVASSVREWWFKIIREHGSYKCYALFLVLPSDREVFEYLVDYGEELDLISGQNCLVFALGNSRFRIPGFDKEIWKVNIREQSTKGYSLSVARLLNIDIDNFPCLVIFRDIRSSEHVMVSLRDLTLSEIIYKLRSIFTVIEQASRIRSDPVKLLVEERNREAFQNKGKTIVNGIRTIAEMTLESTVEVWIKSIIT